MKEVVIIGAGGHAKAIADIIIKSGNKVKGFLDDKIEVNTIIIKEKKIKVIGNLQYIETLKKENSKLYYIIGIGNNIIRNAISQKIDVKYYTAIHPSAIIGLDVEIGLGSTVMANVVINTNSKIGEHVILNTACIVEHDNIIKDFVHISPNASLAGNVVVNNYTHIGIGASVKNNIQIVANSIIGSGAAVVKDIKEQGIYVGVPAIKRKGIVVDD